MLWIGHIAFGYLSTKLILIFAPQFSNSEYNLLMLIGIIASLLPDLDFIPFFIKHRSIKLQKNKSHRKIYSHSPLLWTSILIIAMFFTTSPLALFTCLVILVGSLSHFIADSIEYGIYWLWPFSSVKWRLRQARGSEPLDKENSILGYYTTFIKKVYIKNWTFYIELFIITIAILVFLNS